MEDGTDQDREVEQMLEWAMSEPTPEPPPDLVSRSIETVRRVILAGDLLRFATLEALWSRAQARRAARAESWDEEPPGDS